KAGEEPDLESPFDAKCEVNLHASALLPNDYCPDIHARLGFYKKLSHARDEDEIIGIQEELIDRYGKLPQHAHNQLTTHRLRLLTEHLGIIKLDSSESQAVLRFYTKPQVDPLRSMQLVQERRDLKLSGQDKLRLEFKEGIPLKTRTDALRELLKSLGKRSEEHTSELQSRENLVCRLLLEKK